MTSAGVPPIEQRLVPGTSRSLSEVTILVNPPPVASPVIDARVVALLRKARGRGVTTFDVAGARFPDRAERLIAAAFPERDTAIATVVGRSVESLAQMRTAEGEPWTSANLEEALSRSLEVSRQRLAPVPIGVVEWDPSGTGEADAIPIPTSGVPDDSPKEDELLWSVRLSPRVPGFPEEPVRPTVYSGELSLLQQELVGLFEGKVRPPEARLLARDPFSSGRLDGSRFLAEIGPGAPGAPPVEVRRLHEEFDPVVRLAFLTSERRRTLAQAALQFALHWPWVVSVVVPLPEAERLEEVLGFGGRPPLALEDFLRLASLK